MAPRVVAVCNVARGRNALALVTHDPVKDVGYHLLCSMKFLLSMLLARLISLTLLTYHGAEDVLRPIRGLLPFDVKRFIGLNRLFPRA